MDPLDVMCPTCGADIGVECDEPLTHLARRDEVGDPGPLAVLDWDGDGIPAGLDIDDPAGWM